MRGGTTRSRHLRTILALCLAGAHGCSGGSCRGCSEDGEGKQAASSPETESAEEDLDVPEGLDIEMVALGAEPRFYLRIARWEGLRYRTKLRTAGTFGLVGQPAAAGPTLTMQFLYVVEKGSADPLEVTFDGGVLRLIEERAILEGASLEAEHVPEEALLATNAEFARFRGSAMRQLMTETGGIESLTLELVSGEPPPPELKQVTDDALEQQRHFPFRLPPIPVGVGAEWRFEENVTINGVAAKQTANMVLRGADEDTAKIRITVRLTAPRQSVPHPLEPGNTAMLDVFRGDGDGEITVDRLTGIPLKGRLATTARLTLRGTVAGNPAEATMLGSNVVLLEASILEESEDAGLAVPVPLERDH